MIRLVLTRQRQEKQTMNNKKFVIVVLLALASILAVAGAARIYEFATPEVFLSERHGWVADDGAIVVCLRDNGYGVVTLAFLDVYGIDNLKHVQGVGSNANCQAFPFDWLAERRVQQLVRDGYPVADKRSNQNNTLYPEGWEIR